MKRSGFDTNWEEISDQITAPDPTQMLFSRRHTGIANLHRFLLAIQAAALWLLLRHSGLGFTTLLPEFVYPLAIAFGALVSSDTARQHGGPLSSNAMADFRPTHLDATRAAIRQAAFIGGAIFSTVVLLKDPGLSRFFLVFYMAMLVPCLALLNRFQPHFLARRYFYRRRSISTLLVGSPSGFPHFESWLQRHESLGALFVGCLSYRSHPPPDQVPYLGKFDDLEAVVQSRRPVQVVMLESPSDPADAERLLRICLATGTRLHIHNRFGYSLDYPFQIALEDNHSFLTLQDEPLEEPINRGLKRMFDVAVALTVITTVLAPLGVLVAVMQRLQSPGTLFHVQTRTGLNRSRFRIYKFRTMHPSSSDTAHPATPGDSRVYPFGRFLRRSSLDELPQFINVLRGEMSTVGPRPHLLAHSDAFSRDNDVYLLRYFAKPGITGLAQCNGLRGHMSTPEHLRERIQLDLEYIRTWSIWMDIWITIKTSRQLLFPPNNAI